MPAHMAGPRARQRSMAVELARPARARRGRHAIRRDRVRAAGRGGPSIADDFLPAQLTRLRAMKAWSLFAPDRRDCPGPYYLADVRALAIVLVPPAVLSTSLGL